eukprot:COSAG02_NODE_4536_length_5241_cov_6.296383_3_plen_241_part_00
MTKFTHPTTGAEWAKIPFPTCSSGGNPAGHGFTDGARGPDGVYYCPHGTEYPEPLLDGQRVGLVGFGYCNNTNPTFTEDEKESKVGTRGSCTGDAYHSYNIVDRVVIPADLEAGDYLLSWRWDCEQTHQIWRASSSLAPLLPSACLAPERVLARSCPFSFRLTDAHTPLMRHDICRELCRCSHHQVRGSPWIGSSLTGHAGRLRTNTRNQKCCGAGCSATICIHDCTSMCPTMLAFVWLS